MRPPLRRASLLRRLVDVHRPSQKRLLRRRRDPLALPRSLRRPLRRRRRPLRRRHRPLRHRHLPLHRRRSRRRRSLRKRRPPNLPSPLPRRQPLLRQPPRRPPRLQLRPRLRLLPRPPLHPRLPRRKPRKTPSPIRRLPRAASSTRAPLPSRSRVSVSRPPTQALPRRAATEGSALPWSLRLRATTLQTPRRSGRVRSAKLRRALRQPRRAVTGVAWPTPGVQPARRPGPAGPAGLRVRGVGVVVEAVAPVRSMMA